MKILIVLAALLPAMAFAQEKVKSKPRPFQDGYLIYGDGRKNEGGLVQIPEKKRRLDKCYFRKSSTGVVREIRTEQAVGFGFTNGDVYYAINFTQGDVPGKFFVKLLADGNLSLFDDNEVLILKLDNGTTLELTTSNFRDVLEAATVSCPAANTMAQHLRFDPVVLADFIKGYNECLKNDPATFDPFATRKLFYLGVSAGIEFTTLDITGFNFYPTYSLSGEQHIFAGLLLYMPFAKSQALEFGVIYKPRGFSGTGKGGDPAIHPGVRTTHISIQYEELLIPVIFRQALWRKDKTTIQGSAGVSLPIMLSQTSEASTQDSFNSFVKPVTLSKSIQYNVGIGVEVAVNERHRLLIQNTYFFGSGSLATYIGNTSSTVTGYSLFIGYTLK